MKTADLAPADYNPRKIDAKRLEGLRSSLRRFGNVQPIVVNRLANGEHRIVGGHQRLKLLLEAGESETQVVLVELADRDERALNVALNSAAISGQFQQDLLDPILAEIKLADDDLFRDLNFDDLLEKPLDELDTDPQIGDVAYRIIIDCSDEHEQATLLERFESEGLECKGSVV